MSSSLVGVVNYGIAGNIHSIKKAVEKAGGDVRIVNSKEELADVEKIIIPGVGSFRDAMSELEKSGLLESLREAVGQKTTLGICLGMQILARLGFEYGKTEGLGVLDAEVKPVLVNAKVPHVGFNTIEIQRHCPLLRGIEDESFYFMHSYEVVNYTDIVALTNYSGHKFVSAIQKGNIFGVQFHPEKSREAGIHLFKNFINMQEERV